MYELVAGSHVWAIMFLIAGLALLWGAARPTVKNVKTGHGAAATVCLTFAVATAGAAYVNGSGYFTPCILLALSALHTQFLRKPRPLKGG